ncbi:hypothetical protein C0J52_25979 [Blattella germanica]|nr:hypothetical protein C0J52_25979 [Blattella germanica]
MTPTKTTGHKMVETSREDSAQCNICNTAVTKHDEAVECKYCYRWRHIKCEDLTAGEYQMLKRSRCKLTWLCQECKPQILDQKKKNPETTTKESEQTCEELSRKMDLINETLLQKMTLLLETQLQQTEIIAAPQQPRQTVINQTGKVTSREEAEIQLESKQAEKPDNDARQESNTTTDKEVRQETNNTTPEKDIHSQT